MALVGSISGSLGFTAITGSLLPGVATNDLGSSSSRWNNVYSNFVTGTLRRTAGGNEFLVAGANVTVNYNTSGQWEITSSGGGGGGGETIFTAANSSAAYTTSSIAIGRASAASTVGSDVFFFVSGSRVGDPSSKVALVGGALVTSGAFSVKGAAGNLFIADLQGNFSGSGNLTVGGNQITGSGGGNITLQGSGDVHVAGDLTVAGNDIKSSTGAIALTLNGTNAAVAGDLTVTGNDISGSAGGNIILGAAGDVTVIGDLAVNGGDLTTTQTTFNLVNSTATTVNIAGAAANTTIGAASGRVIVPGDLEVRGTTMTVSASNLVVEDPLVGFGFDSGSIAASSTGDRGFVGGYTGTGNNVAFGYSLASSAFVATRTTDNASSTTFAVSSLQPIRASRFQVSGSTAEVRGDGATLQLSGTQLDVFAGPKGLFLYRDGTLYGDLTGQIGIFNSANGLRLQANGSGTAASVSGSTVWINGDQGQTYFGRNASGVPNSGLLVSVNPGAAGGAGGSVQIAAKQNEGASAPSLPMTLTGSNLNFSVSNSITGISIQDTGTEFATISKAGSATVVRSTNDLVLSGTTATVQTQTGNITLRTAQTTQSVNYNVGVSNYASILSGTYSGGGTDAISLNNVAKLSAVNDLVIAASATAGSIILSGSNSAYLNMGGNVTLQKDGTGFLQFISSSYNLAGVGTSQVAKLEGRNSNGILLVPATGAKVFLSGSVELGGGTENLVNFRGSVGTSILPAADSTYTLGSAALRWQHIYTGDLHLRNERGDYTLIEETDFLSIRFNKNGKRYKFLLERVPELDEPV